MNSITQHYQFQNFSEALAFVNTVGDIAETVNHHPDIFLHNWNQVAITSSTHDAGNTVTQKDQDLIEQIDSAFQKIKKPL